MKSFRWSFGTLPGGEASEAANVDIDFCAEDKSLSIITEKYKNIRRRVDTTTIVNLKKEHVKKIAELLALAAENMPD